MNPRRSAKEVRDPKQWYELLRSMEQAIAETRSMARTLGANEVPFSDWDPAFLTAWVRLLHEAGDAISAADVDDVRRVSEHLGNFAAEFDGRDQRAWPFYGALITNLHNTLDAMESVAEANPIGADARQLIRPRLPIDRTNRNE